MKTIVLQPTWKPDPCTTITVYNLDGEIVLKQFSECEQVSPSQIAWTKKLTGGIYFIIIQNRSLIRTERMIVN